MSATQQKFLAARKRCNFRIFDEESDGSSGSDDVPLLSTVSTNSPFVTPIEVLKRLGTSLIPPLHPSKLLLKPPVDPVGPGFVICFLICFLIYVSSKTPPFTYRPLDVIIIVVFDLISSTLTVFLLGKLLSKGRFQISLLQVLGLLSYSFFGHLLTLLLSYPLYIYPDPQNKISELTSDKSEITSSITQIHDADSVTHSLTFGRDYDEGNPIYSNGPVSTEEMDYKKTRNQWGDNVFLLTLVFIAGPATLRVVLIFLSPIQSPPGRMILGTILGLSHLLLLIFLHASFLHPNFQYGANG